MILNKNIEFIDVECCNCGVIFLVSERLRKNWLETKGTFYCPNGHPQSYTKSNSEKLKEELASKNNSLALKDNIISRLEKQLTEEKNKNIIKTKKYDKRKDNRNSGGKK